MFTLCGFCQNRATQSSGWQANQNVENGKKKHDHKMEEKRIKFHSFMNSDSAVGGKNKLIMY